MDIANAFLSHTHDMKRYGISSDLDNGNNGEFIGIDDLLHFSNEDIGDPIAESCHTAPTENVSSKPSLDSGIVVPADDSTDICLPCDDIAELEWLSNFVEESFSSADASTFNYPGNNGESSNHFQSSSPVSVLETSPSSTKQGCLSPETPVRGRTRSKRSRIGLCIWNTHILSASETSPALIHTTTTAQDLDVCNAYDDSFYSKKPPKSTSPKAKKWVDTTQTRRCLHCATQKTPQWRAGPKGPKTLCNACGVRYKSGRLLPEYRPAASPTFVESIHSNSHRKVLEIRKNREEKDDTEDPIMWEQHKVESSYGDGWCLVDRRLVFPGLLSLGC